MKSRIKNYENWIVVGTATNQKFKLCVYIQANFKKRRNSKPDHNDFKTICLQWSSVRALEVTLNEGVAL